MASRALADTSAWIELFRGGGGSAVRHLKVRLREGWLHTTGVVRLELIAGARSKKDLESIERFLDKTVPVETKEADYTSAGGIVFRMRRRGVTVHALDALIAAICLRTRLPLITTDPDFHPLAEHEGLKLVEVA
jgi:predicted nucleic acid-binding protein